MHFEIERKFLVCGDCRQHAVEAHTMVQGYLCKGSGKTVRVRIRDDKAFLTIKGPSLDGGLSRLEWEKEISRQEAEDLMTLAEGSLIDKTRYLVPVGKHVFEVDEFHGDNEGLVVAEVELGSGTEDFERPDWLGEEVTGDKRYYNSRLTVCPYKDW